MFDFNKAGENIARNREHIESLTYQVQKVLKSKLAIGRSKREDQKLDRLLHNQNHEHQLKATTSKYIYSWSTYNSYIKHCNYFVKHCKQNYGSRSLKDCYEHVDDWLKFRIEQKASPYTQKLEASALAKLYGCRTIDFISTEVRHRSNIQRSRGEKVRDKHFSEKKNQEFVQFCKSTGLRRAELNALTGDKLIQKNQKYYIVVNSGSKGGRYREAPIIDRVELVVSKMKEAGTGPVFQKVPNGADVHSYRSEYCTKIYLSECRDVKSLKPSERYYCRKDRKGTWYDRKAMKAASVALGHQRISVVAEHYLRL